MPTDYKGKIIHNMSQTKFNELLESNGGKLPAEFANSIVHTRAEDVNLSQMRTELVYDMNSDNPSLNWGYTNGIQGGNTAIGGKDFSKYTFLIITARQGNASMTSIMDLTILNTFSNTYNSGALGCEAQDTDYCKFTVNADKTEFTCNRIGYRTTSGSSVDMVHENAVCMKIVGVIKTPAMVYTGAELYEGNGISIKDGVISASNMKVLWTNPNPSSSFSAQTITLSSSDYDYLLFEYKPQHIWNITDYAMCKKGTNAMMYFITTDAAYPRYYIQAGIREASYISDTSYSVGNITVFDLSGYSESNSRAVPVRVIGVKVV